MDIILCILAVIWGSAMITTTMPDIIRMPTRALRAPIFTIAFLMHLPFAWACMTLSGGLLRLLTVAHWRALWIVYWSVITGNYDEMRKEWGIK